MTTTLTPTATTRTPAADALRLLLDDVLLSVGADDDVDRYAGRMPAGQALLALAALARRAAEALGAQPGVSLTSATGIAVQRELAAAARLLDGAVAAADGEPWEIADLLVRAERLPAQLERTPR